MKTFFALVAILSANSAFAAPVCGDLQFKNLGYTVDRFGVGEVTRTEVAEASLELWTELLSCGTINKITYCTLAKFAANTVVNGYEEEKRVGQRTDEEVYQVKKRLAAIEASCQ